MKINPNVSIVIGILVMIEQAIGIGTVSLTDAIPAVFIPAVKSWCMILAFIGTAILTALHGFASAVPGPLASPPTQADVQKVITAAKAAASVLAIAIILAALLSGTARAQAPRLVKPTGNLVNDVQSALHPGEAPLLTGDPVADLHSAMKKGGSKLILHLKRQYALAIAPISDGAGPIDPIAAPCAKALVPIVDLVVNGPKASAVAAGDPMALTADEQTAAADTSQIDGVVVQIEKLRILRIAVQSPALTIACGPLVQDEVKQSKNLMGGLTSLITGTGLLAPIAGL